MKQYFDPRAVLVTVSLISIGLVLVVLGIAVMDFTSPGKITSYQSYKIIKKQSPISLGSIDTKVLAFSSPDEYRDYIAQSNQKFSSFNYGMMMPTRAIQERGDLSNLGLDAFNTKQAEDIGLAGPERISETNVQVAGIDEPDIVKTDGKNIFLSQSNYYYPWRGLLRPEIDIVPPFISGTLKVVKAWPPEQLAQIGKIDTQGEMLLVNKILVVFAHDKIAAYDINTPASPVKAWEIKYNDNNSLVAARLMNEKIYVVTRAYADTEKPCPMKPFIVNEETVSVPCSSVYRPVQVIPADSTFSVMSFNPENGRLEKSLAFLGSAGSSVVAMFPDNIYISYSYPGDIADLIIGAVTEKPDLLPSWLRESLIKLRTYDISQDSKINEFYQLLERYKRSLSKDELLKFENEMQNKISGYIETRQRDFERTGLVKIRVSDLAVIATGVVPGSLLNQFSLDEYEGYLRVATTFGNNWFFSQDLGASDVYVLDSNMVQVGVVKDLGKTERIYSVRFIGNRGYVVTFRQVDPFYVLDLSNPYAPQMTGELKIPGFSSYLHQVADNRILGVGQEGNQVKLSLFDVSDSANPLEVAKYLLDDYWSEISQTHHAFLHDSKHGVVFVPGSRGGYIFNYKSDDLKLTMVVSDIIAKRALYLNDYMYIIGDDKIVVINEIDWRKVNQFTLAP